MTTCERDRETADGDREAPPFPAAIAVATAADAPLAPIIAAAIRDEVARVGTGMALRSAEVIEEAMCGGRAVVALPAPVRAGSAGAGDPAGTVAPADSWAGFCYVAAWDGGRFVSTSGLIVHPAYRRRGIARRLKERALALARERFPAATPFGLTTSPAVVAINRALGFRPAAYGELPAGDAFWRGCESCPLHPRLVANARRSCACTAMVAGR